MLAACLPQGVNPTLPARAGHAVPSAASALGLMEQSNSICYPGHPTCSARAVLELESPDREPGVAFIPQSSSNSYTHVWAGTDGHVLPLDSTCGAAGAGKEFAMLGSLCKKDSTQGSM